MKIPEKSTPEDVLWHRLESYRCGDLDWRSGRAFGYVYDAGQRAAQVAKQAYVEFLAENALDPTTFPSVARLENEVVAMVACHLEAGPDVVGNFTSGGTESIMLAVKAARDCLRARRPEIREPEMVLPVTAHAAFHKAGHYLDVKPIVVRVDETSFAADVAAVRQAITPNTIMLVGSAPSYAHGVVDPIAELGALARERELWLHVDACIGGFLLLYFRRLGASVPDFDLRVPGVSSLSVDLHKYAYAAKGASVILYASRELRRHQIFSCARWTGYSVVNTTVQSTKSAGPIAGAWAVLQFLGDEGYLDIARGLLAATRALVDGIGRIDGLRVLGRPEMCLLAFASERAGVFHIADEMRARGWYVQPQLACGALPESIHLSLGPSNVPHVPRMLADLDDSVAAARKLGASGLGEAVKAAVAGLGPSRMGAETTAQVLAMAGIRGAALPARMAELNEILNALSPELREALLTAYMNELFAPSR